jgi:hypothetical protein
VTSTSRITINPVNMTGSGAGTWPFSFPGNAPSVPASTVNATNTNAYAVAVTISGGTLTFVFVGGVQVGTAAGVYMVPAGGTISVTYSVAPTWTWVAAGVDIGGATSDGANFATAWPQTSQANGAGVQFQNQGTGLTYLMYYNGANACTASYLIGQKYGGDTFPFTQEQQALATNSFGRLGPFSPNKYNQADSTQFTTAPGGVVGNSGLGLTCVDFSNCGTLLVRAYQVIGVTP